MNIQIFGTSKSFDTKKAQRYFSERKIKVQYIDLKEKSMSRGEFNSVKAAVGGFENMLDENCKDKDLLALFWAWQTNKRNVLLLSIAIRRSWFFVMCI